LQGIEQDRERTSLFSVVHASRFLPEMHTAWLLAEMYASRFLPKASLSSRS
jgi:hypothetical protein